MSPVFVWDGEYYWPANKDAVGLCAILSRMKLKILDVETLRIQGHNPKLTNGIEIGKMDVKA